MAAISPRRFILRCYGQKTEKGNLVGVCLDLDIAVEAGSSEELKKKMNRAIQTYLETVLDTENIGSIPHLLTRRASLKDWVLYYCIKLIHNMRKFPGSFTFKEVIPFHFANSL